MERNLKLIQKCEICPHRCKIDRTKNQIGRCKSKDTVKVAIASIHKYEEPCISGKNGSGTVFFSNCNLSCEFCQNYEISQEGLGKEISIERLAQIFLMQQSKGVHNINLVSPTSYAIQIIEAVFTEIYIKRITRKIIHIKFLKMYIMLYWTAKSIQRKALTRTICLKKVLTKF